MNADGVYLACYAALLLSLKLGRGGFYSGKTAVIPITEVRRRDGLSPSQR